MRYFTLAHILQVVSHQDLPSNVRAADREPSMGQLNKLKRKSQERNHRIAQSADVSNGEMLLLKPVRLRGAKVRWPKADLI